MNEFQNIIDRQLGLCARFNYDNVLKRLSVHSEESFHGMQHNTSPEYFDGDPPIFACRFSEAVGYEQVLALANEYGRVTIQDTRTVETAKKMQRFHCHNNAVFDLVWMPLYKKFVTVSGDHTACLWDLSESVLRRELLFTGHSRSVKTATFPRREPRVFATGARDGRVLLWDVRAPARPQLALEPCHTARVAKRGRRALSVTGLVFRDDVTLVSCGECDSTIKVWDTRRSYSVFRGELLPSHSIPYCGFSSRDCYTNLIVDEAGLRLYASCVDDVVYCFNMSTFNSLPEHRYVGHKNSTFYIKTALSPDGAYLVSGSSDEHAYVWNVRSSQPIVRLSGHRAEVTCATWCAGGDLKIATCSDDARHMIWRVGPEFCSPDEETRYRAKAMPCVTKQTHSCLKRCAPTSDTEAKRLRLEVPNPEKDERLGNSTNNRNSSPRGVKHPMSLPGDSTPPKKNCSEPENWTYFSPKAGTSFMTQTKSSKSLSLSDVNSRTPIKSSPNKVKIIRFTTPLENLPNFVLTGEAPHLRLMSPVRKKPKVMDWLTLMLHEKRTKTTEESDGTNVPLARPKEQVNKPHRHSKTEKTPKSSSKTGSILKYFTVAKEAK